MRMLRSQVALLALLVTVWSNVTVFQCGAPVAAGADAHAEDAHARHHGASGDLPAESEDGVPTGDPPQACGVLMPCGTAVRGVAPAVARVIDPPVRDATPRASIAEPSAVDRTQDPPPPRRPA